MPLVTCKLKVSLLNIFVVPLDLETLFYPLSTHRNFPPDCAITLSNILSAVLTPIDIPSATIA
nr:MAG TPA: hypothetical protein [Caudoviricetes sp.]